MSKVIYHLNAIKERLKYSIVLKDVDEKLRHMRRGGWVHIINQKREVGYLGGALRVGIGIGTNAGTDKEGIGTSFRPGMVLEGVPFYFWVVYHEGNNGKRITG